jgi:hybrid cluster-associated redox disulfide protein
MVSKDMIIADILEIDRNLAAILMQHGMRCMGCRGATGKSLEQGAISHGIDPDVLVKQMNEFLTNKDGLAEE